MKRIYGASPIHLLAHLASLALAAWALAQILEARAATTIVIWLIGAVLLHDALLWPFYSLLDRTVQRAARPVAATNHLRVPLGLSALMLLAGFPAILELREGNYTRVSGVGFDGYLERWLLVSGLLFAGSAALYAIRARRAAGPRHR